MSRGRECFRYAVTVVQVEIEVENPGPSLLHARLGEQHDPQNNVGNVAEPTCSISLSMMPTSVPVDRDVDLVICQELTRRASRSSYK
jgi:hypothetical protein